MLTAEQKRSLTRKGIEWRRLDVVPASYAVSAVRRGDGLIVDVRRSDHYEKEHFPVAVNARAEPDLLALPREKDISLYCT